MKTEVLMRREFLGGEVKQSSKNGFFSLTDLGKIGNRWRIDNGLGLFDIRQHLQQKGQKEFIKELEKEYGVVKINKRGRNGYTLVHPLLFIDIALAMSPKLKIKVYGRLYDSLLKYRNDSGDSYKKMTGALFDRITYKAKFPETIKKVAQYIKDKCGVKDWQKATEQQLELRDKMHENIALLLGVMKNLKQAVNIGVEKALEK